MDFPEISIPRTQSPEPIYDYPPRGTEELHPSPVLDSSISSTPPAHWRPKLTIYRLLVILTTLGFSVAKAVLSYQGRTIAPITLEWLFGTGIFLLFFALDTYQNGVKPPACPWFFEVDLLYLSWKRLYGIFGVPSSSFAGNSGGRRESTLRGRPIPIRGYDLLVMTTTILFGVIKSILAYAGYNTGMTTIEWVSSGVVGVSIYWLGLYENNPINIMPKIFEKDYSRSIRKILRKPILIAPLLAVIAFASWWSYLCIGWIEVISEVFHKPQRALETFFEKALVTFVIPCFGLAMISALVIAIGAAIFSVLVIALSRFRHEMLRENAALLWNHIIPFFLMFLVNFILLPFCLSYICFCISFIVDPHTWKKDTWDSSFSSGVTSVLPIVLLYGLPVWKSGEMVIMYMSLATRMSVLATLKRCAGYVQRWRDYAEEV